MTGYPKLAADSGRIVPNRDVPTGQLKLALFEAPMEFAPSDEPTVLLAASAQTPGWRRHYVEIQHLGRVHVLRTAPCKSVLGGAETTLGAADESVEVLLYDADQWLVSCRDEDLKLGDNAAFLGGEILQFAEATSLGGGRFRLARLRRGRAGTESAIASHSQGDPFALIERNALQAIPLPQWVAGSPVHATAQNGSAECSLIPAFDGRIERRPKL